MTSFVKEADAETIYLLFESNEEFNSGFFLKIEIMRQQTRDICDVKR